MKHIKLLENIKSINVIKRYSYEELINDIIEKTNTILNSVNLNDRITKKYVQNKIISQNLNLNPLVPPFGYENPEIIRSFRYKDVNEYARKIANFYTKYSMYNIDKESITKTKAWIENRSLFNKLISLWSENDSNDFTLITNQYTNWMDAALHYFYWKFHDDERYNLIVEEIHFSSDTEIFNLITHNVTLEYKLEFDIMKPFLLFMFCELTLEKNIICAKCKSTNEYYLESHWQQRYTSWHLYIPFSTFTLPLFNQTDSGVKVSLESSLLPEDSLLNLKIFCEAYGGIPSSKEVNLPMIDIINSANIIDAWLNIPYDWYYKNHFGSFKHALFESGLIDNNALKSKYGTYNVAKDGHLCNSLAEGKIDNWMTDNNIQHEKEPFYPYDPEFNPNVKLRADWKVKNMYIEYFGLINQSSYSENASRKIRLAEKLKLQLISIYNLDEIEIKLGKLTQKSNGA